MGSKRHCHSIYLVVVKMPVVWMLFFLYTKCAKQRIPLSKVKIEASESAGHNEEGKCSDDVDLATTIGMSTSDETVD